MIYKLESINVVIAKIVRDLGLNNSSIDDHDYVEWIADALKQIGAYAQFEEVEGIIEITDYTGLLPCDFYKLVRLEPGCSEKKSSCDDNFNGCSNKAAFDDAGCDFSKLDPYQQDLLLNPAKPQKIQTLPKRAERFHHNKHLFGNVANNLLDDRDYNIQGNILKVGYETGTVTVQYLRIPTDEQGYPKIPDDVGFREALFWYVAYHISMRNPQLLVNQRMKDMEYCNQKWQKYCSQARSYANMPDVHQMESIINTFWRQIRDVSAPLTDYTDIGTKQHLILDGIY